MRVLDNSGSWVPVSIRRVRHFGIITASAVESSGGETWQATIVSSKVVTTRRIKEV